MLDSLRRGWSFFKQAIDMARKDPDLLKPSIFSLLANIVVGLVFSAPIIVAAIVLGGEDSLVGQAVLFVLGALMLFAQYTVTHVFSGMTVYLIYGFLAEGDGRMDKAWAIVRRDVFDLMSLAAASAAVKLVENFLRGNRRRPSAVGSLVAGVLENVWTTATYFVLPAMIIEDLNLWNALKRATYMIKNNLLLVGVGFVGVSVINNLVGGIVIFAAILGGVAVAFALSSLGGAGFIVGLALAVALVLVVVAVVNVVTSYIGTAYHTSLFLWAREIEKVQQRGLAPQAALAPAPLAAVMGSP